MNNPEDFDPDRWSAMSGGTLEDLVVDRRLGHPSIHNKPGKHGREQASVRTTPSSLPRSHRVASLEIPLRLDDSSGGIISVERKTNMHVYSSFPVSGPWRVGLGASTNMRGRTGYSTGNGDIYYSLGSLGSLRGGVVVGESPSLILGGMCHVGGDGTSAKKPKTSFVTATVQTRPRNWAHSGLSISTRHTIDPRLTVQTSTSLNPLRKTSFRINLVSKTVYQWNVGLGWHQQRPLFSLQLTPRLWSSPRRLLQLSTSWYGGKSPGWTVGGTLTQPQQHHVQQHQQPWKPNPSASASKLSVGLTHSSALSLDKRMVWIFSLTQGEFTLRIPIILGFMSSASSSFWYAVKVSYFGFLSIVIQDIVADVLQLESKHTSDQQLADQQRQLNREKSRTDAEQQQRFMERQAKIRTQAEQDKGGSGLKIIRAVYHVDGGDRWDVTVPLQFWVADSCLRLAGSSKRNMLGFYNVAASVSDNVSSSRAEVDQSPSVSIKSRLNDWLWKPLTTSIDNHGEVSSARSVPAKLSVQYEVAGYFYETTIQDDEELFLPSPQAVVINKSAVHFTTE